MSFRNAVLLLNLRRGRREALGGVAVHATSRSEKHSYEGKPSAPDLRRAHCRRFHYPRQWKQQSQLLIVLRIGMEMPPEA
jgi:hypothetical protein